MAAINTYSETSLLSITRKGGDDREFSTYIETFEVSGGEKGVESIPMISGGRRKRFSPEEDTEITLEGYAIEAGTDTGAIGKGFLDLKGAEVTTQPNAIVSDHIHDEFRVAILNTDSAAITAATSATAEGDKALRMVFQNGHFTNVETSFSDNVLKFSVTFKVPAFDASNNSNILTNSTDGSTGKVLDALASFA